MFRYTRVKEREMNVRIIYAGILIDRVGRVTGCLIDDEQGGLERGEGV